MYVKLVGKLYIWEISEKEQRDLCVKSKQLSIKIYRRLNQHNEVIVLGRKVMCVGI